MKIGLVEVGADCPCRVVAEIGANHNGKVDTALRLIQAVHHAGADLIKFQCYTIDEVLLLRGDGQAPAPWEGYTLRALYEKAQTPLKWFPSLVAECERVGIPWFSSVFGLESLACLEAMGCPAYKIARLDSDQRWLTETARATGKPVVISVKHAQPYSSDLDAVLMLYCPPGYPTRHEDVRLPLMWDHPYSGLSSHCLAPELPIAAVARGAKLLEYHLQLRDEPAELDGAFSLTEYQFKTMVESVRRTEEMLG